MENIVDTFYNEIIPGLLTGQINCNILIRVIANVLFIENNKLFKAKPPVEGLYIPTLKINDRKKLNELLIEYINVMKNFHFTKMKYFTEEDLPKYYIACAIANMTEEDYANPEKYFEKLCYIHKNNPINEQDVELGYSEPLNGDLSVHVRNECPNQECPFVFKALLDTELGTYNFPVIRFYVIDDAVYIGSIQNTQSKQDEKLNKKIRRKLYKVNEGIENEGLLNVDPAVVASLSMFLSFIKQYGINKVQLLPYSLQRSNDKKLQAYHLNKVLENPQTSYKAKIISVFEKTALYFERLPKVRGQLETSLLRMNYHFPGVVIYIDNNTPSLYVDDLENCNNELLTDLNNLVKNKKTR